jgi:hypothetical protein
MTDSKGSIITIMEICTVCRAVKVTPILTTYQTIETVTSHQGSLAITLTQTRKVTTATPTTVSIFKTQVTEKEGIMATLIQNCTACQVVTPTSTVKQPTVVLTLVSETAIQSVTTAPVFPITTAYVVETKTIEREGSIITITETCTVCQAVTVTPSPTTVFTMETLTTKKGDSTVLVTAPKPVVTAPPPVVSIYKTQVTEQGGTTVTITEKCTACRAVTVTPTLTPSTVVVKPSSVFVITTIPEQPTVTSPPPTSYVVETKTIEQEGSIITVTETCTVCQAVTITPSATTIFTIETLTTKKGDSTVVVTASKNVVTAPPPIVSIYKTQVTEQNGSTVTITQHCTACQAVTVTPTPVTISLTKTKVKQGSTAIVTEKNNSLPTTVSAIGTTQIIVQTKTVEQEGTTVVVTKHCTDCQAITITPAPSTIYAYETLTTQQEGKTYVVTQKCTTCPATVTAPSAVVSIVKTQVTEIEGSTVVITQPCYDCHPVTISPTPVIVYSTYTEVRHGTNVVVTEAISTCDTTTYAAVTPTAEVVKTVTEVQQGTTMVLTKPCTECTKLTINPPPTVQTQQETQAQPTSKPLKTVEVLQPSSVSQAQMPSATPETTTPASSVPPAVSTLMTSHTHVPVTSRPPVSGVSKGAASHNLVSLSSVASLVVSVFGVLLLG